MIRELHLVLHWLNTKEPNMIGVHPSLCLNCHHHIITADLKLKVSSNQNYTPPSPNKRVALG